MDKERLKGKVAIVTGAGAGIGEAICHRFAAEGATVVAMDRREEAVQRVVGALRDAGGAGHAHTGDVADESDGRRVVDWTLEHLGAIHVLCNVAGIVDGGTLVEVTDESWQRSMDVNAKGTFLLCRRVVPAMVRQGGGSIINMASVAGPFAVPNRSVYATSKAAVIGLTKSLAVDFVGNGIRANAICPGTVDTPSWRDRVNQAPDPAQALQSFIARQPMGRVGRPDEIAALAAYLASGESAYMTGQAIAIDGGWTM